MHRFAVALLIFVSCEAAAQEWTGADYALLGGALTMTAIDWGQTRDIAKQPDRLSERNRFLGAHPTTTEVDRYFGLYMVSQVALSYVMPQVPRRLFLGGVMVIEGRAAYKNYQLGLNVSF